MMRGDGRSENRAQEVGQVALGRKQLAQELKVPVPAGAQLSRAVEQRGDRRPILSDLSESGDLENHADNVLFIYRPDVYASDQAEIIVAKQRNGPTHPGLPLRFRGATTMTTMSGARPNLRRAYRLPPAGETLTRQRMIAGLRAVFQRTRVASAQHNSFKPLDERMAALIAFLLSMTKRFTNLGI